MATIVKVRKRTANDRTTKKGVIIEYVATYQVEFDSPDYLLPVAMFATDGTTAVPSSGTMPLVIGATTITLYYKSTDGRREDAKIAEIFVTWSSDPEFQPTTPEAGDKRNIQVTIDGVAFEEGVNRDKDGKLITNSAGDPFPADIKKTYYDEKISVSWTTDGVDTGAVADLRGKINTGIVNMTIGGQTRNFAAKTLKLTGCSIKKTIAKDDTGFDCSIELIYRKDTWTQHLTDQGFYVLDDNGDRYRVVDRDGNEVSQPIYLDGNGQELDTSGDDPVDAVTIDVEIDQDANLASVLAGIV